MMDSGENHLPTGYEFDFVDPLSSEKECSICRNALRNPVQLTSCGHRYCKTCLKSWVESDHREPFCPQDRKPIPAEGEWFHDQACEREILALRVKCKKNKQGCNWIGELCHYYQSKHIDICPFEDVTCENCNIHMERGFLDMHTASECPCRIVECEYCEEKLEFWKKQNHEDETCLCFPLKCPQRCGMSVPRKEMEFHVREACMMIKVFCPFKEAGCTFHDIRSNLTTHLEASRDEHLRDVTEQLKQRKTEITSLKKRVKEQKVEVGALQIENALLNDRLSKLERGTEKMKKRVNELEKVQGHLEELQRKETALQVENVLLNDRLSNLEKGTAKMKKRVNKLEKGQGQLQELQRKTECTKTRIRELEVVKNQVAELQAWKNSAPWQRVMEEQDERIMRSMRSSELKTNFLKERVERLQRQNDETSNFMKEQMNQFVDNVVCKFKAALETQQLNPATRPVNSTNQLSMPRTSETPTDDRNRLPVNHTQAALDPDNMVRARKRQKEERKLKMAKKLKSKMNNGQPKRTNSDTMSLSTDRRNEIEDSDEDDFYFELI